MPRASRIRAPYARSLPVPDLLLLGTVLIWGGNFVVSKVAVKYFSPPAFVTLRYMLATPLLLLLLKVSGERTSIKGGDFRAFVVLGLLGVTLYQMFFIYAVTYTTATNASLLTNTSPLFGAVLALISGQERPSLKKYAGLLLAFGGLVAFLHSSASSTGVGTGSLLGDGLGLVGALCFATYSTLSVPLLRKYSPLTSTAFAALFGTLGLMAINGVQIIHFNWHVVPLPGWLALTYTTLFSTVFAFVAWYAGLKAVGTTGAMVYQYLVPIAGGLCSVVFLKEAITVKQILAGLVVISGIAVTKSAEGGMRTARRG